MNIIFGLEKTVIKPPTLSPKASISSLSKMGKIPTGQNFCAEGQTASPTQSAPCRLGPEVR